VSAGSAGSSSTWLTSRSSTTIGDRGSAKRHTSEGKGTPRGQISRAVAGTLVCGHRQTAVEPKAPELTETIEAVKQDASTHVAAYFTFEDLGRPIRASMISLQEYRPTNMCSLICEERHFNQEYEDHPRHHS